MSKIVGCVENGIPAEVANKIFGDMEGFASYAFNKSHAAAYAVLAYQTAWLKKYYCKQSWSYTEARRERLTPISSNAPA